MGTVREPTKFDAERVKQCWAMVVYRLDRKRG